MVTPQIISYVQAQLSQGVSEEKIAADLSGAGWSSVDIAAVFAQLQGGSSVPPPIPAPFPTQAAPAVQPVIVAEQPASVIAGNTQSAAPLTFNTQYLIIAGAVGAVILLLGGGIAFAYLNGFSIFTPKAPYAEGELFSGISKAVQTIQTSSYSLSGELKVEPRDKDAAPFSVHPSNEADLQTKYQNDVTRLNNATSIVRALTWMHPATSSYPASLDTIPSNSTNRYYTASLSTLDPVTHEPYRYVVSPDGKSFELSVTFDTDYPITAARAQAKSYGFMSAGQQASSQPGISGRTLTFTNTTAYYGLYLPSQLPKPYFEQLSDTAQYLPQELNAHAAVTALADWTKKQSDWKFNVDAAGDFGDLTYKINIDALRKDEDYYFRINNLPSLFMGFMPLKKGDWVKIAHDTPTSTSPYGMYNPMSSLANSVHTGEAEYQKTREDLAAFNKAMLQIADSTKVIHFKNPPTLETVDGKKLFRYNLEVQKGSVVEFYKQLLAEAKKHPSTAAQPLFADQSMLDYLSSPEFDQVFDYYIKNTSLTLWVDPAGMPARFEYSMRIVPPDTAKQLADKQARLTITLKMSDINAPVTIDAPKDAKPLEEVMKQSGGGVLGSLETAREKGQDASIKSNLNNLRAEAELYYDSNNNSYAGFCGSNDFQSANTQVSNVLTATSSIKCTATPAAWVAYARLVNATGTYYCVDSTGYTTSLNTAPAVGVLCNGSPLSTMRASSASGFPKPQQTPTPQSANIHASAVQADAVVQKYVTSAAASGQIYKNANSGSYEGFCSSQQVRQVNSEIILYTGKQSTLMCKSSPTAFHAYAGLVSDRSMFACVDSAGNNTTFTLPVPTGDTCIK